MKKTVLITGTNSGIGKEAAIQLLQNGCHVIACCRNKEKAEKVIEEIKKESNSNDIRLIIMDMSSLKSIKVASESILKEYSNIDVLIHNAADFDISRKNIEYSEDGIEKVFATNHLGPVYLTDILLPIIPKTNNSRIITVASQGLMMHPFLKINFDDIEFKNSKYSVEKAYYQSKLAQIMYTYWLSEKLKEQNICVNSVWVTNVKIDISRYPNLTDFQKKLYNMKSKFSITASEMAKTYVAIALSDSFKDITGKVVDKDLKFINTNSYSKNKENIDRLMNLTYQYLKNI